MMTSGPEIVVDKSLASAPYTVIPYQQNIRRIFDTVEVPRSQTDKTKLIFSRRPRGVAFLRRKLFGALKTNGTMYVYTDRHYDAQQRAKNKRELKSAQQELDLTIAHEAQHLKDTATESTAYKRQRRFVGTEYALYLASILPVENSLGLLKNPNFSLPIFIASVTAGLFVIPALNDTILYKYLPMEKAAFAKEKELKKQGFFVGAATLVQRSN